MKEQHDWAGTWVYTDMHKQGGYFRATYCKLCGMSFELFKIQPLTCSQYNIKDILE